MGNNVLYDLHNVFVLEFYVTGLICNLFYFCFFCREDVSRRHVMYRHAPETNQTRREESLAIPTQPQHATEQKTSNLHFLCEPWQLCAFPHQLIPKFEVPCLNSFFRSCGGKEKLRITGLDISYTSDQLYIVTCLHFSLTSTLALPTGMLCVTRLVTTSTAVPRSAQIPFVVLFQYFMQRRICR
jgi:hypothetical protein